MKGFKDTTRTCYSKGGPVPGPRGAAAMSKTMSAYRKGVLHQATSAYLAVLDGVTLADLVAPADVTVKMPGSLKSRPKPGLPA